MTKKSSGIFLVPILSVSLIGGLAFYLLKYEPMLSFKMIAIIVLMLLMLSVPIYRSIRNARDNRNSIPLEVEMSRVLEIHAGAYAFRYSMMTWFAIFIFRSKFPDSEEMLGIGIMAAAAIYGVTWLYFKRNGIPHENQD